ncbi:MAG: hypothetical protein SGI88_19485 [Candidatus Hydrogenedentes bacterium]|nr:hypothetical protein [Candidatus Hydrogenedentota bacterium]
MKSLASARFWEFYKSLPSEIRALADKNFHLWQANPRHPSLRFKPIHDDLWSVRIGAHYRAIGKFRDGESFIWLWIGTHERYDKF